MEINNIEKRKKQKYKLSKKEKGLVPFIVFSAIFIFVFFLYAILPSAVGLIGSVGFIVYSIYVAVTSVCTLFMVLFSQDWKDSVSYGYAVIDKIFHSGKDAVSYISPFYPYIAIVCSIIVYAGLTLAIVFFTKRKEEEKRIKGQFIALCILAGIYTILLTICTILYCMAY